MPPAGAATEMNVFKFTKERREWELKCFNVRKVSHGFSQVEFEGLNRF
jgi:hypothetical protein